MTSNQFSFCSPARPQNTSSWDHRPDCQVRCSRGRWTLLARSQRETAIASNGDVAQFLLVEGKIQSQFAYLFGPIGIIKAIFADRFRHARSSDHNEIYGSVKLRCTPPYN